MKDEKVDNRASALAGAGYRTIPNAYFSLTGSAKDLASVTGTGGDATASDLRGCWVMIQNATGADVTVIRGTTGLAAPSAGAGKIIKDGTTEEFFVDSDGGSVIRASATGLTLLYDTKLAKAA